MENPMIQLREFHDGTWSIMAKVWNPQKEIYEHPELINLKKEDAQKYIKEIINKKYSVNDIIRDWVYIGS